MRQGFSLVELSIVLVILGLLTGGILAGQSLIRAAELRSVNADLQRYTAATRTFQDKYMGLPGDLRNATSFWGSVTTSGGTCPASAGTGTQTCDGDGSGLIGDASACNGAHERPRYWQHLVNGGLIEGTYTGVVGSGSCNEVLPGTNAPRARFANAGYSVISSNLLVGAAVAASTNSSPVFSPDEAWSVDIKLDDGLPRTGLVTVPGIATNPGCSDTDVTTGTYQVQNTGKLCALYMSLTRR